MCEVCAYLVEELRERDKRIEELIDHDPDPIWQDLHFKVSQDYHRILGEMMPEGRVDLFKRLIEHLMSIIIDGKPLSVLHQGHIYAMELVYGDKAGGILQQLKNRQEEENG